MSWQDLGGLGELVSAVAVVVSLIYLAYQIRQNTNQIDQNTKAVRASAIDSSVGHAMDTRQAIFESADVARILLSGHADPNALTENDLTRYRLILHNVMWSFWNIFSQTKFAELATETWDAQVPAILRILVTPGGRWFWDNYAQEFEISFQSEVNRMLEQSDSQEAGRAPAE